MTGVNNFTDLLIWQKARQWSKAIFQHTQQEPFQLDRRVVVQVNDPPESVMSNIAEGFGRGTQGEFVAFLGYAIGSLNETQSHLCAAYDREYFPREVFDRLFNQGTEIRRMTVSFVRSMVMPGSGVKHVRKPVNFSEDVWSCFERITGEQRPEMFRKRPE